ncbi:hypothetical protein DH2020_026480 [Rehmannia glutinosa]|uniref:CCT domain-containing protein n=1 Tax=Rehmannia glutinosa TaxID=99300 RepID=A0ABR0W191_REHGL
MSSCLSGGGRAYRLESLDLEMIKSPSSTSWISNNSSSPSSTLSESSNCPLAIISTRKPRTPRKRPNQTYNEAAAILSTAYPKIFPTKHLTKPCKFTKSLENKNPFSFEPSDLLMPFQVIDTSGYLLHPAQSPTFSIEPKLGIDSIMGNLGIENESIENSSTNNVNTMQMNGFCYGYPVGLGFEFGYGMRKEMRAMRNVDEGDWWRFPSVNVLDVTPKISKTPAEKKKKKKVEIKNSDSGKENENSISIVEPERENLGLQSPSEESVPQPNVGLLLKLNYDSVLDAWSDKASPFSGDTPGSEPTGNDVQARLAQIDLFSDNGGIREASVLRYKEKRRTRLFSKKIRYQVRKVNADRRPRMKGRFVRTPNSSDD